MPDRRPPQRLSLRFALLAAIGGLMVLLPFGEVLRYQGEEIRELMSERAALDPLSRALQVQRGLLGHDEVASRVLAGRQQLEAERRLRQADVDGALWNLKGTLSSGLWIRALAEADALTDDWRDLARRIHLRQVDSQASHAAHQLLVEQSLQVMDLVSAATAPGPAQALGRLLSPALARQTAADEGTARRQRLQGVDTAQAALTAYLHRLDGRLATLQAARRAQATGLAMLGLALAAAAVGFFLRARSTPPPSPEPTSGRSHDGVRRGHGRRITDAQRQADEAERLMWQLRQGAADTVPHPSDTLPPGLDKT